ncbi:uncharacterized protein LOC144608952 [Rhinoraja longicauda]
MADCHVPSPARRVQFKEPECDDFKSNEPLSDLNSTPTRKVLLKGSEFDCLHKSLASKPESVAAVCEDQTPLPNPINEFEVCVAPRADLENSAWDNPCAPNTGMDGLRNSVCADLSTPIAPAAYIKDTICDAYCFTPGGPLEDPLRDDFNPSTTLKVPVDSMCYDLKPGLECKDTSGDLTQSYAPQVEDKRETRGADHIPVRPPATKDKKKLWFPCANPGNPIFSCMEKIPTLPRSPVPFVKPQNSLFRTTSADYGSNEPTCDIAPSVYKPISQSFSEALHVGGMYRDGSLNTKSDKKRIHDLLPI